MDFDEYQKKAAATGFYDTDDKKYVMMYLCLGIAGEGGEVIEKIKKVIRNDNGIVSEEKKDAIKKEIGDVLWYLAELSRTLGIPFNEVAEANIEKVMDRKERGVIKSEGDIR
jgi:NTP pyrophosphatase (non-canonical NTP hydrolase)